MEPPLSPLEVAAQLVGGIEGGNLDAVRSVYAPGVVVWTCFDDQERDVETSLGVLEWFIAGTRERHYEIVRRVEIEGGVLQQHVLRATTHQGKAFAMPACIVLQIDGGLITRIDEYIDPKPVIGAIG